MKLVHLLSQSAAVSFRYPQTASISEGGKTLTHSSA